VPVNLDDCAVDELIFEIGIFRQRCENSLKHAFERPSPEAFPHGGPLAEALGQIAPRRTGAYKLQNGFDKQTVVLARSDRIALFAGQKRSNPFPLGIVQQRSVQG
jgi:hypothetical protein